MNLPVFMTDEFWATHWGRDSPKNNEKPNMKRFRDEFRSTNCKLEIPTAVIIPEENYKLLLNTWNQCIQGFNGSFWGLRILTKHHHEYSTNDGLWNGNKESPKLAKHSEDHHDDPGSLYHATASNLHQWNMWCTCDWSIESCLMVATFVMPMAPMFSLYEVVPEPVPQHPAKTQPTPSMKMPGEEWRNWWEIWCIR